MIKLLEFVASFCSFLFEANRFRIVDSDATDSFGGNALVVLVSRVLRLRLVRDRGQIVADFQSAERPVARHWHSIDVVRQLVTGEETRTAEMVSDNVDFLRNRLDEIELRFSQARIGETLRALKKLEQARAKRLFD